MARKDPKSLVNINRKVKNNSIDVQLMVITIISVSPKIKRLIERAFKRKRIEHFVIGKILRKTFIGSTMYVAKVTLQVVDKKQAGSVFSLIDTALQLHNKMSIGYSGDLYIIDMQIVNQKVAGALR